MQLAAQDAERLRLRRQQDVSDPISVLNTMTRIPCVISVFKCGVAAARTQLAALDAERLRLRQQ